MNVSRRCMDGSVHPEESVNKQQLYVTTAGYKGEFAYDKLIQLLIRMVLQPEKAFVMGGTYRIPAAFKLIDKNFITDLKEDGTFNEASFNREYESIWSGTVENAFFNGDVFDRNRILLQPEYKYSKRSNEHAYYVLSVDVGRRQCQTVICVFKVTPQPNGPAIKTLVNMYTIEDEHFEDQAIKIKKLFYEYHARTVVIDGNGLGAGLMDYMVKNQIDEFGNVISNFGVENDNKQEWKKFRTPETEDDAIYEMKANAPINTEAHSITQAQLRAGKVKFLVDEKVAKNKLMGSQLGKKMTPEERAEYLRPFTLTSILREELLNLREENEGMNIILKQANRNIGKDKFSASIKI